ncbi:Spliceosome-associated protein 49, partial [Coemansia sp. RSA 1694]
MNRVRIGACTSTDKEYIAGREDLPIRQQVHRILQTATVMAIDSDAPGLLIFDAICEAPNTAIIQHLELGRLWCAADDIIKLLVALPSLVNLCCSVSKLESEIEAIPASERPSRLCAKYHPLSNSFRVLQVRSYSDLSGELVACTAMLVAVLCPNFVQVDLPLELRKAFGREIAWALVNDTFKPYADSINRLIYKESTLHCMAQKNERNQEASVYIGNLDDRVTDELIWELMVQAGPVVNVHLPKDRVTQSTQGYGFCEFQTSEDADYAVKVMNMVKLYGKPMRVNKSANDRRLMDVGAKLFIGNLDPEIDEKLLFDTFAAFGP